VPVYQIDGRDLIFEWLAQETDQSQRQRMLDWLTIFADDPLANAHRVPGVRAPVYLVVTPIRRVTLTFLHAEQFHTVKLLEWGTLP